MQIESLKIFCDVVRCSSFSRGAEESGVTQSSASQAVQHLEERLGVKLIDRSKRPLAPTARGRLFYEGCKELIERYAELEAKVKAGESGDTVTGTVGVAAIYSVGLHHMKRFVQDFQARHPRASVRLEYLHPERVVERVTSGEAEIGLLSCPKKWPDLNVIAWRDEAMVLAVHPSHRFAKRSSVAVAELDGEPFVAFDPNLPIRRSVDKFLRHHSAHVSIVLEFDNIENIKRAVEVASGVSVLPEPSLAREVQTGTLVALPLDAPSADDRLVRPLAIIHRRHGLLDPAASSFLDMLTREAPTAGTAAADGRTAAAPPAARREGRGPRKAAARSH